MSKRALYGIAIGGLVMSLVAVTFLAFEFFGGSEPAPVSLSTSAPGATTAPPGTEARSGQQGQQTQEASFDGTWTIDNSGTFDYDAGIFDSTFAGYRVDEQLEGIGANTAVGRTPNVQGSMTIAGTQITDVSITVDMSSLRSDDSRRDDKLGELGLETWSFQTATFELTEPIGIDRAPQPGETMNAQATGDLTLHGVTREVTIPLEARWDGSRITVVSSFEVALADYDMETPTIGFVLSVSEVGTCEFQLHFVKAS